MFKSFQIAFALFILPVITAAQISNVSYRISFNPSTNLYDCFLHVNEGSATKVKERVQLNAQLTLLVPSGSEVEIAQNFMPIQDNQSYGGTKPMNWSKANVVKKPGADPFHDYVSIVPQLSPASFYNNLKAGDQVKLFSARISHVSNCGDDVRLFDNEQGLSSTEVGMNGGDFRNGFTLGGIKQKYSKNETSVTPSIDVVKDIVTKNKKEIYLEAITTENSKYGPYSYEWHTPSGTKVSGKTISFLKPSSMDYGTYELIATDARGCKQSKTVELKSDQATPAHEMVNGLNTNALNMVSTRAETASGDSPQVSLYPNPAVNEFFINLDTEIGTKIDLTLTDITGRNIFKNIISTVATETKMNIHIPAENLEAGAYNVVARINGKESVHKVIIVK